VVGPGNAHATAVIAVAPGLGRGAPTRPGSSPASSRWPRCLAWPTCNVRSWLTGCGGWPTATSPWGC